MAFQKHLLQWGCTDAGLCYQTTGTVDKARETAVNYFNRIF